MDILHDDLFEVWKALHQCDVKFILIGGFAVNLNGYSRFTSDVDLWIKAEKQNRIQLNESLKQIGIIVPDGFENSELVPGWSSIILPTGIELDLMSSLKGLHANQFDECYHLAPEVLIEKIPVRFLHVNHLLQTKKATGRPQDLIDVEELEKIYSGK